MTLRASWGPGLRARASPPGGESVPGHGSPCCAARGRGAWLDLKPKEGTRRTDVQSLVFPEWYVSHLGTCRRSPRVVGRRADRILEVGAWRGKGKPEDATLNERSRSQIEAGAACILTSTECSRRSSTRGIALSCRSTPSTVTLVSPFPPDVCRT